MGELSRVGVDGGAKAPVASLWLPNTTYKANQMVFYAGQVYAAIADFTSGASFSAANWTPLSPREVSYAELPGASASVTTSEADVSGWTAAFTAVNGLVYVFSWSADVTPSTTQAITLSLYDTTAGGAGTLVALRLVRLVNGLDTTAEVTVRLAGLSGAKTYKTRASVNTGTCTINHGVTYPAQFRVVQE